MTGRRQTTATAPDHSRHDLPEQEYHLSLVPECPSRVGLPGPPSSSHRQSSTSNSSLSLDVATSIQSKHGSHDLNQPDFNFPLTADHLITLIQYNVYRACISNIILLNLGDLVNEKCKFGTSLPPPTSIPINLWPTHLQQAIPHPSWIDVFPDPKLRDNMIIAQDFYNEQSFFNDLIGEVCGRIGLCPTAQRGSILDLGKADQERGGLIVWSDPWDVNSWEVTPGFLRKWGWMLRGCNELLAGSDRWRTQRGERPLLAKTL